MLALTHRIAARPFTLRLPTSPCVVKCLRLSCMSAAPPATTFPEFPKRRKLNTSSNRPFQRHISSLTMAPVLIQEVEDDTPSTTQHLELTPVEATLRQLLLDVASYIDTNPAAHPQAEAQVHLPDQLAAEKLTLRWTGGWVRDKLLGVPSHDIDVAINKMTGFQFGLRLKEYLEIPGNPEKYGLEGVAATDKSDAKAGTTDKSKTVGGLHKIEANPEKSKHLETVTTRILGLDIDLVNLRKESYTDDSRNPQMEFGTPEEDALRRDATVNAMFYNIHTQSVEDFTGRGRQDMQDRIIRTPLEPWQTFKDDPLRVLRLIRFASRLEYEIEAKAQMAMMDEGIKEALKKKISRERVGIEVEKALKGPNPHEALRLIFELGLYETVFCDPMASEKVAYTADTERWRPMIDFLQDTLALDSTLAEVLVKDTEDSFLAWQLAALVPYNGAPQPEPLKAGGKVPPPIAAAVTREGIKAPSKVCDIVTAAVRHQVEIAEMVDRLDVRKRRPDRNARDGLVDAGARDVLGMALRRWGTSWRTQVMFSMLAEVANGELSTESIERKYTTFATQLKDLDLLDVCNFKPLLDGKTLAKALNTPPGPWMKDALDVVMAYQLRHPDSATAEAAIAAVQSNRNNGTTNGHFNDAGELTSSLIHHFLSLTVRPLFIKAKVSSVTETGRKNTNTILPQRMTGRDTEEVTKPWKHDRNAFAVDLLRWCVRALDSKTVEREWHLLIPPLLTLVDDHETEYKTLGISFIRSVLEATPSALLAKTGLGSVFEDAVLPSLTYLPEITPLEESTALLEEAYPALLTLCQVRYPPAIPPQTSKQSLDGERTGYLDTLLRKGIIYGYTHCPTYPLITSLLFRYLALILNELGVESVRHLKYILPILTETLSQPLFHDGDTATEPSIPQLRNLLDATKALQAVVLNAWPRMVENRGEVLRGLCFAWVRVRDAAGESVEEVRWEMRETVAMLKCVVEKEVDWEGELGGLVEAEERVAGLFETEIGVA